MIRRLYSNPPIHPARIMSRLLTNEEHFEEWQAGVKAGRNRVQEMREALVAELKALGTPGDFDYITSNVGWFSYAPLTSIINYSFKSY